MLPKRSHCPPSDTHRRSCGRRSSRSLLSTTLQRKPAIGASTSALPWTRSFSGLGRLPVEPPSQGVSPTIPLCIALFSGGLSLDFGSHLGLPLGGCEELKGVDWGACSGATSSPTPLSPAHPNTAPRCSLGARGSACSVSGQRSVTSLVLVCASDLSSDCIQPRPRQSAFFVLGCPGRILFRVLFSP